MRSMRLMKAASGKASLDILGFYDQQHTANTWWGFAKVHIAGLPTAGALALAANFIASESTPQGLSNLSWASGRLSIEAAAMMDMLSTEVLDRKSELAVQNPASIKQAPSAISHMHQRFVERAEFGNTGIGDTIGGDAFGGPNIQSMLWSLWKMGRCDLAEQVCK